MKKRPTRQTLHMKTARLWARRSLCLKDNRAVGCVITTEDMKQILSFGYNGPPQQLGNHACTGVMGRCGCLHAEINALLKVDGNLPNKVMFVTMEPCIDCATAIAQAGVKTVYYCDQYRQANSGTGLLTKCGIVTIQIKRLT